MIIRQGNEEDKDKIQSSDAPIILLAVGELAGKLVCSTLLEMDKEDCSKIDARLVTPVVEASKWDTIFPQQKRVLSAPYHFSTVCIFDDILKGSNPLDYEQAKKVSHNTIDLFVPLFETEIVEIVIALCTYDYYGYMAFALAKLAINYHKNVTIFLYQVAPKEILEKKRRDCHEKLVQEASNISKESDVFMIEDLMSRFPLITSTTIFQYYDDIERLHVDKIKDILGKIIF